MKNLYPERDLNPHALMNTWPSTMPVYQFQHPGKYAIETEFLKGKVISKKNNFGKIQNYRT